MPAISPVSALYQADSLQDITSHTAYQVWNELIVEAIKEQQTNPVFVQNPETFKVEVPLAKAVSKLKQKLGCSASDLHNNGAMNLQAFKASGWKIGVMLQHSLNKQSLVIFEGFHNG